MAQTRKPVPAPPKKSGGASAAAKGVKPPAKTPAKKPAAKDKLNSGPITRIDKEPAKSSPKRDDGDLEKQFRKFVKTDKRFAQGRYKNTVKIEFVLGLILIVLYPILRPNYSPIEWMKRMLAWGFIYLGILSVANTSREMARFAAYFGGLIVLGMLVYEHTSSEGLIAGNIMTKLAKALLPSGSVVTTAAQTKPTKPQSAWLWENWPWGGPPGTEAKQQNNAPNTTQTA